MPRKYDTPMKNSQCYKLAKKQTRYIQQHWIKQRVENEVKV